MPEAKKILLINDDEPTLKYLKEKIASKLDCLVFPQSSAQEGLAAFKQGEFDLVIINLSIPDLNAKDVVKGLKKIDSDCIIIAIIDEDKPYLADEMAGLGIYEFISKSANLERLIFLIKKGMELYALAASHNKLMYSLKEQNETLQKQNTLLAKRIEEATKNLTRLYEDLRTTYMRTIKVLAQAIDARDHYTHSHSQNVAKYAVAIAEELDLSASDIDKIRQACELHDLGKIGVDDSILSKPSSLTEEEWEQIKRHPLTGAQILEPLTFLGGVVDLVRQHHEWYNGSGYPLGIKGEDILLGARIINLADAYEAMTSARSYRKKPFSKDEAVAEIKRNSGKQFDPKIVAVFLKIVDKL